MNAGSQTQLLARQKAAKRQFTSKVKWLLVCAILFVCSTQFIRKIQRINQLSTVFFFKTVVLDLGPCTNGLPTNGFRIKHIFSLFRMTGNNPFNSFVSLKTSIEKLQRHQNFQITLVRNCEYIKP